jgi:hypothetical protein
VLDELDACPVVFDSERAFFYSGVKFHNYINKKLGNPTVTYELANHIWRRNKPEKRERQIPIVTSLSPSRLDHQMACIQTWLDSGFFVFIMQNKYEIPDLLPQVPLSVEWVPISSQRPYIKDMAHYGMILNSDISMSGSGPFSIYPNTLYLRWNYNPGLPSQEEQWGIDGMYLNPHDIPDDLPFMIGEPFWDYSIPAIFKHNNIPFSIKHDLWLHHLRHELNWSQADWQRGHDWVSSHIPGDISSPEFRQSLDPDYTYNAKLGIWKSTQESTLTQTQNTTSPGHREVLNIFQGGHTIRTTT